MTDTGLSEDGTNRKMYSDKTTSKVWELKCPLNNNQQLLQVYPSHSYSSQNTQSDC